MPWFINPGYTVYKNSVEECAQGDSCPEEAIECHFTPSGGSRTDCSDLLSTSCNPSSWSPLESTVCSGETFTQTSNCGTTRSRAGSKSCSGLCEIFCLESANYSFTAADKTECSNHHKSSNNCNGENDDAYECFFTPESGDREAC